MTPGSNSIPSAIIGLAAERCQRYLAPPDLVGLEPKRAMGHRDNGIPRQDMHPASSGRGA
jgi:hypothetical protein